MSPRRWPFVVGFGFVWLGVFAGALAAQAWVNARADVALAAIFAGVGATIGVAFLSVGVVEG